MIWSVYFFGGVLIFLVWYIRLVWFTPKDQWVDDDMLLGSCVAFIWILVIPIAIVMFILNQLAYRIPIVDFLIKERKWFWRIRNET